MIPLQRRHEQVSLSGEAAASLSLVDLGGILIAEDWLQQGDMAVLVLCHRLSWEALVPSTHPHSRGIEEMGDADLAPGAWWSLVWWELEKRGQFLP